MATASEALIEALTAIRPDALCNFGPGGDKLVAESALLDRLLAEGCVEQQVRLWDQEPCLVTTRRIARLPGFQNACEKSGWPVVVRRSGGTTVLHRPGVVNVSLFLVGPDGGLKDGFDSLCGLILAATTQMGLALDAGSVSRSYCDGTHNIRWRGRKVAGTAALARRRGDWHGRLFHASIVADGDAAADAAVIEAFEQAAGLAVRYDPNMHISLAQAAAVSRSSFGLRPNLAL
ncbi:MAG: hypothetical protein AB7G25_04450 [Sphingomonadaceae bacterium]